MYPYVHNQNYNIKKVKKKKNNNIKKYIFKKF